MTANASGTLGGAAASRGFTLLAEGLYTGKIIDQGWDFSSNGNPGYTLTALLDCYLNPTNDVSEKLDPPVRRRVTKWLSPKAVKRSLSELRKAGYPAHDLSGLDPKNLEAFDFAGLPICVSVRHGEFDGRPKEEMNIERRQLTEEEKLAAFEKTKAALIEANAEEKKKVEQKAEQKRLAEQLAAAPVNFAEEPQEEGVYTDEDTAE